MDKACADDCTLNACQVTQPDVLADCQAISAFWKVEQGESQITDVQGRLRKCLDFWERTLDPASWIISCICDGYKLPLRAIPEKFSKPNQQSALRHKDFVRQSIQDLEKNRCIVRVYEPPHICIPLSVVGEIETCVKSLVPQSVLVAGNMRILIRTAMLMFQKGDYMFSFDLKSGYHHVDIYEPHRVYLGFSWTVQGLTQYYVFAVLLASACYAFTKLLRLLIKYWRGQGFGPCSTLMMELWQYQVRKQLI